MTWLTTALRNLHDFIKWHRPGAVATMSKLEEHFDLSKDEIAMIESCIEHKLLREYVVFTENHYENHYVAYITLEVSEIRKLINQRRRNIINLWKM